MKLTIPTPGLLSALQVAGRAVSSRSTLPSLSGILVTAERGVATVRATDMEISLLCELPGAEIERDGSVLLPGRLLIDVIRNLPPGSVVIEQRPEPRDVELIAGDARFHLRTLAAEDFPRLPEAEGEIVTLPAKPFAETIELVARAASRDEVRPILTGVMVQAEGAALTMVATDSYRLSVKHTSLGDAIPQPLEANVPARALRELARAITANDVGEVQIAVTRNQAVFQIEGLRMSSRLIEGQFPSWRQLVPETFEHEVRLPRADLLEVTRRIGQMAQRNAPLRMAFSEGELTVSAETPDIGDASESMPAPYSGEPLEIAFNPQFLIEGIESVGSDELLVLLSSPLRPGLLRPAGEEDFSYLVMPIRLNV